MKLAHLLSLGIVAGSLIGCAGLPPEVAKSVEDISVGVQQADEGSRELYALALSLCDYAPRPEECADKVKAASMPVRKGFGIVRVAYCAIKPSEPLCKETP